jgi:formiminotetrahydrofolate cyclodeaminase
MSQTWGGTPEPQAPEPTQPAPAETAHAQAPPAAPASQSWATPPATASGPPPKVPIETLPTAGSRLSTYLDELASDSPTPGGGAWAAVSAAAGASLVAMVARLTVKKKGFEHVAERMRAVADECDDERYTLLALADKDAEAYQDVMAAYKLPKATPEEQRTWSITLQRALERAADIPLEVARRSVYLMSLAEETLTSGNPNAASDALSAATSLHAAALSALANVDINAITFIDKTRQQELADSASALRNRAQSILRDVSEAFFIALHA